MEIVFKAPSLPRSLLNLDDSLAQRPWETSSALLCAIRDATLATYLEEEHRSLLLASFKALQLQESWFRSNLRNLTADWVPTAKEEQIIQAAYHGFYPVDDIEGAFCKYGGLYGIVALAMVFRDTHSILKQWAAIDVEAAQQWLVSNVAQLFACKKNKWIDNFIPQVPHNPFPLKYLGHHANRRKSVVSQARCQQPSTLTSIPSPPDQVQQLQEKHYNGRASSPTQQPTPTSNTSSSGEDFSQQHRQLSTSNQNDNPFHILPPQRVQDLSGSFFSSPCSSPFNSKSPGPTHITDNDDPAGSLGVVAPGGGAAGSCEANYPASQHQNIQGTSPDREGISGRIYRTSPAGGVSPEAFIPPLFYAMGDHIPKFMLDRAISPQPRWNEQGEFFEVTPHDAGLHQDLVDLLSGDVKLKQSTQELLSLSIISEVSRDGLQAYACRDEEARISFDQNRAYWIHRAFELCCHVFPRSQILDSSFGSVGKELLHVLQHLLGLYRKAGLEIPPRRDAVEALVAASKFGEMSNRRYLLSIAAELQRDPEQTDLRAMIVYRESVLLRFSKKISESRRTIQQFFDRPFTVANPRLHCLVGLLHLSQAENWAYQFKNQEVYEEAQKWEPGDSPTGMRLYVLRTKLKVLGQSYKGDGHFEDAKKAFEGCLKAMRPHDSERYFVKSTLADVFCELNYLKSKDYEIEDYLGKAESIVCPELNYLRIRSRTSRQYRRLLLSLIEIEILRGRDVVAETLIKELVAMYESLTEPDVLDQVGHLRALMAWARISTLSDAVVRWRNALRWNIIYDPSQEDAFGSGVAYLFISLACFNLGDVPESEANFARASKIISTKKPQFLMPGVGTYLYDFVRRELWSKAKWQLPRGLP